MDEHIKRLSRLPQRSGEVWQGGLVRLPHWITGEGPKPYRALAPLWVAVRADKVHTGQLLRPDERDPAAAVAALVEFALRSDVGGYRPGRVEVTDEELAKALEFLPEAGIKVRVVERLAAVDRMLDSMMEFGGGGRTAPPGPLDVEDVTVERMRRFAEAAAAYFRAAPWQHLTNVDFLEIEKPKPPAGMSVAVVLGAGRSVYGLGLYGSRDDFFWNYRGSDRNAGRRPEAWQVSFNPPMETTPKDADLWEDHDLPVASDEAYPMAMWFGGRGRIRRPTATELSFLEGILWAMAGTREAEIDSGRWQKTVDTYDDPLAFTLSLPDLLNPPSHQEWMERGFEPDRRAHERTFADMDRYFEAHPPASVDDMNAVLKTRFTGKRFDELATTPQTALDRAQDLCYQAFQTHGRRRVQVAPQALGTCPDCADAYVILAEQAGALEAELDNYTKGVAAGERALGPRALAEHQGHFWGVASTRPYMRARLGLALCLEQLGRIEEAVDHYQEMLCLNPNDNQGVRHLLMPRLLQLGRDVEAARLLKQSDEQSANWVYARALLAFRLSGRSTAARRELRKAFGTNPHVPEVLLAEEPLPMPPHYSPGSPEEALVCVEELRPAFSQTEGALDWLTSEYRRHQREQTARQRQRQTKQRQTRKKRKRR